MAIRILMYFGENIETIPLSGELIWTLTFNSNAHFSALLGLCGDPYGGIVYKLHLDLEKTSTRVHIYILAFSS